MDELTPDQRTDLTSQLERLNRNIENQFVYIRRRRYGWLLMFAALSAVYAHGEVQRNAEQRAQDRASCLSTNVARAEVKVAISRTLLKVETIAPASARASVERLRADSAKDLNRAMPNKEC